MAKFYLQEADPSLKTGSISKLIPKIKTKSGPIKNVGTHIPIIAIAIGIKSRYVFLLRAAKTPDEIPIIMQLILHKKLIQKLLAIQ